MPSVEIDGSLLDLLPWAPVSLTETRVFRLVRDRFTSRVDTERPIAVKTAVVIYPGIKVGRERQDEAVIEDEEFAVQSREASASEASRLVWRRGRKNVIPGTGWSGERPEVD